MSGPPVGRAHVVEPDPHLGCRLPKAPRISTKIRASAWPANDRDLPDFIPVDAHRQVEACSRGENNARLFANILPASVRCTWRFVREQLHLPSSRLPYLLTERGWLDGTLSRMPEMQVSATATT